MKTESILHDEDAIAAMGYASLHDQETLLGAVVAMTDHHKKAAATKKIMKKQIVGGHLTPRDEALKRLGLIDEHIRNGLAKQDLQLSDAVFYAVKPVGGVSGQVRMFVDSDSKAPGVTNINKARFEKDQWFLCTAIRVTSGIDPDPKNAAYGIIPLAIANGDFEFKSNSKYILPQDNSMNIFDTTNQADIARGVYKLSTPKWMEPQTPVEFNFRPSEALAANTNVKVELIGIQVLPA